MIIVRERKERGLKWNVFVLPSLCYKWVKFVFGRNEPGYHCEDEEE